MVSKRSSFEENGEAAHSLNSNEYTASSDPDLDIHNELNKVEEIVFDSFHIPLSRITIVNEERLLRQLDEVKQKIPEQFELALDVLRRKNLIISEAEDCAKQILDSAKKRANQILNESGIIQQAEMEAREIRENVHQECEALQLHTLAEVEKTRNSAQQELEQMRQATIQECDNIQRDADEYADAVLNNLEHNLREMLRIVENGRRQIHSP